MNIQKKYKNKKYIIPTVALIILGVAAITVYTFAQYSPQPTPDYINKPISDGIDYSGPSETDKEYNRQQEERNKEREQLDNQAPATSADIIITDAAQYNDTIEVRAYIANLYEKDGICTATFTKENQPNVSTKSNALADAKTIQCGALDIKRSQFPQSGTWTLHVSYNSDAATGTSDSRKVTIE